MPRITLVTIFLIVFPIFVFAQSTHVSQKKIGEPNTMTTNLHDSTFIVSQNGTVTDSRTGLTWKKCSEGQTGSNCDGLANIYTWEHALQQAQNVNSKGGFAGHKDWRVPTLNELKSLIERDIDPAINSKIFINTPNQDGRYWTSLADINFAKEYAWIVYFYNGTQESTSKRMELYLRLVRG
jgi:hypothetical protein